MNFQATSVLSDLANMIKNLDESVFNYLKNADAPFEDLAPLVVVCKSFKSGGLQGR